MEYRFSAKIRTLLEDAGWYEGRRIDINYVKSIMLVQKLDFFLAFEHFIEEFNGLLIRNTIDNDINKVIIFDVEEGMKELKHLEFLDDFKHVIGCQQLAIIGASTTDWTLLIDNCSNFYRVDTQNINSYGKGANGLENLINYTNATKINLPEWWWEKY